jgi:O-antigen/teichoic acid export membrane protein
MFCAGKNKEYKNKLNILENLFAYLFILLLLLLLLLLLKEYIIPVCIGENTNKYKIKAD